MNWDDILKQPQAEYPDLNFVRFVARNYYDRMDSVRFLDIGCGAGANSKFIEDQCFDVVRVDLSPTVKADIYGDIRLLEFQEDQFDCILDFNTLCHVEDPPFKKIKSWLRDDGVFFSVCPTQSTWRGHLAGKGYCRCATKPEIQELYSDFKELQIGYACYPVGEQTISSWIIEARK